MRNVAVALALLGAIMVAILLWRLTGGPLGPRTWAFIAATVAVLVAAAVTWRRSARVSGPGA